MLQTISMFARSSFGIAVSPATSGIAEEEDLLCRVERSLENLLSLQQDECSPEMTAAVGRIRCRILEDIQATQDEHQTAVDALQRQIDTLQEQLEIQDNNTQFLDRLQAQEGPRQQVDCDGNECLSPATIQDSRDNRIDELEADLARLRSHKKAADVAKQQEIEGLRDMLLKKACERTRLMRQIKDFETAERSYAEKRMVVNKGQSDVIRGLVSKVEDKDKQLKLLIKRQNQDSRKADALKLVLKEEGDRFAKENEDLRFVIKMLSRKLKQVKQQKITNGHVKVESESAFEIPVGEAGKRINDYGTDPGEHLMQGSCFSFLSKQ